MKIIKRTYNKFHLFIKCIALIVFFCISSHAKSQQYTEYDLKAIYLFNFAKFVSWSYTETKTFIIGVYGDNPFGDVLIEIADSKNSDGKYYLINYYNNPDEIDYCNILFINNVENVELEKILQIAKEKNILTVGDEINNFCDMGGIINFLPKEINKPFEINNRSAIESKIKISPKLLKLSVICGN